MLSSFWNQSDREETVDRSTPAFGSRSSLVTFVQYFVLLFFELDQVGGDNGRFRLTPTKENAAKSMILAIKSAERANPAAVLAGYHCVAKEPKIVDLTYNF